MNLNPAPYVVTSAGSESDAPAGAIPIELYGAGGGEGGSVTSEDITDASQVGRDVLTAASATAARTAIGAGTGSSNLAVGTTAGAALASAGAAGSSSQAARADHVHPYPTAAQIGAAATTHNQAATTVTVAAATGIVGANVQLVLADLAARVVALETAAA